TGSTRLPNKMLMPFYNGKGILEILIDRIRAEFHPDFNNLVIATTTSAGDDKIADLCERLNVKCFRGSENDVLKRFIDAAHNYNSDKIIRICADNVFLDTKLLYQLYDKLTKSDCDYVSYKTCSGIPSIKTHYGFWAEGVSLKALESVYDETDDSLYHEHVTNYIYTHPEKFTICLQPICETINGIEDHPDLRLTIDTIEDFNISQFVFSNLSEQEIAVDSLNILAFLEKHPELYAKMKIIIDKNAK
ncbi:MAG: glycosyltransferase family protein, partial [Muribaculaceae bacterium]|nr:glycosyltransferase family protein [Muribaculaceae bacterium]